MFLKQFHLCLHLLHRLEDFLSFEIHTEFCNLSEDICLSINRDGKQWESQALLYCFTSFYFPLSFISFSFPLSLPFPFFILYSSSLLTPVSSFSSSFSSLLFHFLFPHFCLSCPFFLGCVCFSFFNLCQAPPLPSPKSLSHLPKPKGLASMI